MRPHRCGRATTRFLLRPGNSRTSFALLKEDGAHPSLQLKRIGRFYSVRVGLHYRALGVEAQDGIL